MRRTDGGHVIYDWSGGLSEPGRDPTVMATRSLLRQVVDRGGEGAVPKPLPRKLTPGTRLVRDWHGVGHTVIVLESGFEYDGKHWKSLTAIAKVITGAHWNGPRFFGLTGRKS